MTRRPGDRSGFPVLAIAVNYNNIHEISSFLDELIRNHPIEDTVIVDDGSTDGSDREATKRGFRVLAHKNNRGIGAAIRTGLRHAIETCRWKAVVILSCNGKMKPADLPRVLDPLTGDSADYVQGNRFLPLAESQLPISRHLGVRLFSVVGCFFLRRWFSDLTCGFRAYRVDFLERPELDIDQPWLDRYEMEFYLHWWACRLGLRIAQVPVCIDYSHLPNSRFSKIRPLIHWWSMLRPFLFLTMPRRRPFWP